MSSLSLSFLAICVQVYFLPVDLDNTWEAKSTSSWIPWGNRVTSGWKPWGNKSSTGWKNWGNKSSSGWQNWGNKSAGAWKPWGNKSATGWKNWGNRSSSGWKNWGNKSSSGWKNWGNKSSSGWKNWGNKSAGGWKQWEKRSTYSKGNWSRSYTKWSRYSTSSLHLRTTTELIEEEEQVDPRVKLILKKHGIVPDIIPVAPEHELKIKYVDKVVDLGTKIPPNVTRLAPTVVRWPVDEANHMHTLIMIDPDIPSRKDPWKKEWQHWIVVNIPYGRVWAGEELTEYRGIKECHGPGYHRYIFLVYHQPDNELIHFTEPRLGLPPVDMDRSHFSTLKFTTKYKLGDPVAANFFTAKWEPYEDTLHPYSPFHNITIHEKDMINEFEHRFTMAHVDYKKNHTDYILNMTTEEPDDFDMLEHIKNL